MYFCFQILTNVLGRLVPMECVIITPAPLLATVPRQDTRGTFAKMVSRIIIIKIIIKIYNNNNNTRVSQK